MKYSEILKTNKELERTLSGEKYEIVVLSNIITSQLFEILEYFLRVENINAYVKCGDYDNIVQDSDKFKDSNLVIIFWELANIVDGLQYKINLLDEKEVKNLLSKVKSEIDFVVSNLKDNSLALINKFSSLVFNYQNLKHNNLDNVCKELNSYLEQKIMSNMKLVDIDKILSKISIERSVDFRFYYSSKALYTIEFYKEYTNYIKPIILFAKGKVKKVLIFDCDNTLWKGILGEDGFDGIEMSSKTKDGAIFEEAQTMAVELSKKGVLLGLCSKNNPQDADYVLKNHPDMVIKDKHIVIKKINWDDKITNVNAIAKELNIGLDSLVFIDDSDFEVNLIKEYLPQVTVLQVPSQLHEYPKMVRESIMLFYHFSETSEDIQKIKMYKQQVKRESEKGSFKNIEDYLRSLGLKLTIYIDTLSTVPRASQLTQKTNQFNLTTKRYTEMDIEKFINSKDYLVFIFRAEDKFGDYGMTGLCIIQLDFKNKKAITDTLLMSCRVIGRNLEFAFFDFIVDYLKTSGFTFLEAKFIKTSKNEQVHNLYESLEFNIVSKSDSEKLYSLEICTYKQKRINYIQVCNGT